MAPTIEIRLIPRPPFRAYLQRAQRFACLVCHRRAGKTFATLQDLIARAMGNARREPPPRYGYIAPTRDQAKDIAWGYLQRFVAQIPGVEFNQAELSLRLLNGAQIRLYSGDSYERMRGLHFDGVIIDEPADIAPDAWSAVIRPCLADFAGWATFIGTPKGRDAFFERWTEAQAKPEEWFSLLLKASASGLIARGELASIRAGISAHLYQQEFECDFDAPIAGAIYADALVTARLENRVAVMPVDPHALVHTSWDLGSPLNTALWYWQVVGRAIRVIDIDHRLDLTLTQRVGHILGKGYPLGYHYLPHDAAAKNATGLTMQEEMTRAGLHNTRVVPRTHDIWVGINALQQLWPLLEFRLPQCDPGLIALAAYRRHPQADATMGMVRDEPVHDWASHYCFTGETKVWTRIGLRRIDSLPCKGSILTPRGWRDYRNPRLTRRDALLVEVRFSDGFTVRCTPDHSFMTEDGWKSAESLHPGSLILSASTRAPSSSMAGFTGYGTENGIFPERAGADSIATYGKERLGLFHQPATFTTGTTTRQTTRSTILSASLAGSIAPSIARKRTGGDWCILHRRPERRPENGTSQRGAGSGTRTFTKSGFGRMLSRCLLPVKDAVSSICGSPQSTGSRRLNSAPVPASSVMVASVKRLAAREDVWCLTVPGVGAFCLENGAVVKNCDALRIMAEAWNAGFFKFAHGPNLEPANTPPREEWQRRRRRGVRPIEVSAGFPG